MTTTITMTPTIPTPPFLEFIIGPFASMSDEAHSPPLPTFSLSSSGSTSRSAVSSVREASRTGRGRLLQDRATLNRGDGPGPGGGGGRSGTRSAPRIKGGGQEPGGHTNRGGADARPRDPGGGHRRQHAPNGDPRPAPCRVLMVGDLIGKAGSGSPWSRTLPELRESRGIDFVTANGESMAGGMGADPAPAEALFAAGVDVIISWPHLGQARDLPVPGDVRPGPPCRSTTGLTTCPARAG